MMTPIRGRGRPRDPDVDAAILDAARTLLAARGFTGMSMERIARAAGVGKDAIYRRWDSKESLVRHLLTVLADEHVPARTHEEPAYALFLFLQDIVGLNSRSNFGGIVAGLVGESSRNQTMADGFRSFWRERRTVAAGLLRRALDPSTTPAEIEHHLDHLLGPIYYRMLLTGEPITDEYLWELVTDLPLQDQP